jgi:hypothetical protein
MDKVWKNVVAAVTAVLTCVFVGILTFAIITLFPIPGAVLEAGLVGAFVIALGAMGFGVGREICERLFGWFY